MDQATTKVERYLLEQTSYLNQQNVIIGEVLDQVREQTFKTNGRVTDAEMAAVVVKSELSTHNKILTGYEERTKRWRRWQAAFIPVGTALLIFILDLIAKYFHWT